MNQSHSSLEFSEDDVHEARHMPENTIITNITINEREKSRISGQVRTRQPITVKRDNELKRSNSAHAHDTVKLN